MIRKARVLGIAAVAIFAMSALAASAAHATAAHFRCGDGTGTCKITIEADPSKPTQLIKTQAGNTSCETLEAHYEGTATAAEPTFTGIKYGECELGGLTATVNFEGKAGTPCHYTLTAGNTEAEPEKSTGSLTLGPAGCKVTTQTLKCTKTIEGSQSFQNTVTYENVHTTGQKEEITGHITISGLVYTLSAGCPNPGVHNDGVYEGTFTARATDTSGNPVDLTLVDT